MPVMEDQLPLLAPPLRPKLNTTRGEISRAGSSPYSTAAHQLSSMSVDILPLLKATLEPDGNIRMAAELELVKANVYPQTALSLAQIVRETSIDVSLRQMTGSVLKKYVKEQWSPFFPEFKGPQATTVEVKAEVRALIFGGLSDPVRKMRLACASITSLIAHPDWPDDWPTLMTQLLELVASTPDAVDGGMRVLHDFVGIDLTEDQLLPIARNMLPQMLAILGSPQVNSPSTRARAILIFRQCVMTLFTVKDEHPAAVKAAVSEILPQWIDAFGQLLSQDVSQELLGDNWEGLSVRIAIFKTLEIIINSFPSTLKSSLGHFLNLSATHLSAVASVYQIAYLSTTSDFSIPSSSEEDSEVPSDLPTFVSTILDFVSQVARRKAVKGLFVSGSKVEPLLDAVMDNIVQYAQMTTEDEDDWASDPNAFVADEDDEMVSLNVRSAALDLVLTLVETFETTALAAMWSAFQRRAAASDAARSASSPDWWKGYEGALTVAGAASDDLLEHIQEQAASNAAPVFDLGRIFTSIIPAFLSDSSFPFLQGRSFVFASKFSQALPSELATQYIDAAIQVLEDASAGVPVKVSAVRALNYFFRHLKENIDSGRAATAFSRLLPLVPQTSENTLCLVLETIEATLKVAGSVLDQNATSSLVKTILNAWFDSAEDPMLGSVVCELFDSLSKVSNPVVQQVIQQEALPSLANIVLDVKHDPYSAKASAALEVISAIFDGQPSPLTPGIFATIAGALFDGLTNVQDRDVLQTGLQVVITVVRKDVNQLLEWRSNEGQTGLDLVLAVVARLLQPSESESGGLFVGDLVLHLIRQAGAAVGPVLPELLKAFVVRLPTAKTASFAQSLVLPFLYLVHTQFDTVLSLLEGLEVPATGSSPARPALEVLLSTWCEYVDVFQGFWNQKVSTVALTQLFAAARPTVQQVSVKGDLLLTAANSNTIMTRARAKNNPDQFPPIPFPAKALKILLHDVQSSGDDATLAKNVNIEDIGSDDGDDEWDDEGAEFTKGDKDLDFLSEMLGKDGSLSKYMHDEDDDGVSIDEEDLKDDPIYQLDIQAHLYAFFREVYAKNTSSFRELAEQYLTQAEKEVLAHILQSA